MPGVSRTALILSLLLTAGGLRADQGQSYLLRNFDNGKAVGGNIYDAGPLSDHDEDPYSKTRVLIAPVPDGAEGQAIKVVVSMPPNPNLGYEYAGVYFSLDRFDASDFDAVRVQMRLPGGLGLLCPLQMIVTEDDPVYGVTKYQADLWFFLSNTTGWQDVVVPFARLLDRRANSLRGRRITSVAFSVAKAGNYEFHLDNLEFVATHGGVAAALDPVRPEYKVVGDVTDDQDFAKATTNEEYLNLQLSPRIGYLEGRFNLAAGNANGTAELANFSNLTNTSPTKLQLPYYAYPTGDTGLGFILDGWGKNAIGLKSISLGNNLVDYSDATYFQTWFPAWAAPQYSTLPFLGSARVQGDAYGLSYDLIGALANYEGTDATTFGGKFRDDGLTLIGTSSSLVARSTAAGNPSVPVYHDAELTGQYDWGKLKDPIRFSLWGAVFQSTNYFLTANTANIYNQGQAFYDVDPNRVIQNQQLLSPVTHDDDGIQAELFLNGFLLPGNQIALSADWIGPWLQPLFRDYVDGGVDAIYYDTAGGDVSMTQPLWFLNLQGEASEGTEPTDLFDRRTQQTLGASWHDIFGSGLTLGIKNIYLEDANELDDQVTYFWDQRYRVSWSYSASLPLGPWAELSARYRTDNDNLYSNYGGARSSEGDTLASMLQLEAKINVCANTHFYLTCSRETPFAYYTYYDPYLLENYNSVKLESTF